VVILPGSAIREAFSGGDKEIHTILTHFCLDSISHSGFGGIEMLPERNQSFRKSVHLRRNRRFPEAAVHSRQPLASVVYLTATLPGRNHSGTTITAHGLCEDTNRAASAESTNTQISAGENCERRTSATDRHSSSSELLVAPPDVAF
jgi:hypothetical protein